MPLKNVLNAKLILVLLPSLTTTSCIKFDGNKSKTFSSAYTTNAYSVTVTSNTTTSTYQAALVAVNNSVAVIRTANATSTNVFFMAIGK